MVSSEGTTRSTNFEFEMIGPRSSHTTLASYGIAITPRSLALAPTHDDDKYPSVMYPGLRLAPPVEWESYHTGYDTDARWRDAGDLIDGWVDPFQGGQLQQPPYADLSSFLFFFTVLILKLRLAGFTTLLHQWGCCRDKQPSLWVSIPFPWAYKERRSSRSSLPSHSAPPLLSPLFPT